MIIVDPVAMVEGAATRASPATFVNESGLVALAPANQFRVTFDPADLTAPPCALFEPAGSNLLLYSAQFEQATWAKEGGSVIANAIAGPDGAMSADKFVETWTAGEHYTEQAVAVSAGANLAFSIFVKAGEKAQVQLSIIGRSGSGAATHVSFDAATGRISAASGGAGLMQDCRAEKYPNGWWRVWQTVTLGAETSCSCRVSLFGEGGAATAYVGNGASGVYLWGAQLEQDGRCTSYIGTAAAPGVRAQDLIPTAAALLYSNVAVSEPAYSVTATYAKGDKVVDPSSKRVYESLVDGNVGAALTDTAKWTPRSATNRWRMFDQYNNTQTESAELITIVLTPQQISQGIYIGNLDSTEYSIVVQDRVEGIVYTERRSLVVSNTGSSFFKWFFSRIRRKTYAVSVQLPPYVNAIVTVCIRRPGGVAKCGMCAIGPLVDVGLSSYGISSEIKDYSSTTFKFDGTSTTIERGYAKRMSVDVELETEAVEAVFEMLAEWRQKPVVFVGSALHGPAIVFGKYSSFKVIIAGLVLSKVSMQIEGTV